MVDGSGICGLRHSRMSFIFDRCRIGLANPIVVAIYKSK
jgi:hypothetical protein